MGADTPRRRSWPYHVALVLAAYAVTLVVAVAALLGWLGSEDGDAGGRPGEATARASSAAGPAPTDAPVRDRPGWKLVWHDEFRGARCPNPTRWSFENGFIRNDELQLYRPSNALCARGHLNIRARHEENPVP